jgi:hypothetical protein
MTVLVLRHCERSVAIHAFAAFCTSKIKEPKIPGGRLRVILARRESILAGAV